MPLAHVAPATVGGSCGGLGRRQPVYSNACAGGFHRSDGLGETVKVAVYAVRILFVTAGGLVIVALAVAAVDFVAGSS